MDRTMIKRRVKVDDRDTMLTRVYVAGNGAHQWNEPGNVSAHTFPVSLELTPGSRFRINGHRYEVIA